MKDYIVKAIAKNGSVRAFAAVTTSMVEEARRLHDMYPVATCALGRTLTAAAILGSMLKGEKDSVTVRVKGDGPLGTIVAVSDMSACVKGYVHYPHVVLPLRGDGKVDVGRGVGTEGYLHIIQDMGLKEPYIGQVHLENGEIAEDLTHYFAKSEQIPSAVGLGVLVDMDYSVKAAGGFIIQLMPQAEEGVIDRIEAAILTLPPVTSMIAEGWDGEMIINKLLEGLEPEILQCMDTCYRCECSAERLERVLISLGEEEISSMIAEQQGAELTCYFCNTRYQYNSQQLQQILNNARTEG